MTNAGFVSLEDYRDIESLGTYRDLVGAGVYTPEEMMACLQEISRDNARTPMQWNDSENAGFTTGTPWIRVNDNYREINAAAQVDDPDSVFSYYRTLIRLRHTDPAVVYGTFVPMLEEDPAVYTYRRVLEDDHALAVYCNFTSEEVPCGWEDGEVLLSNYAGHKADLLQPYEAIVLRVG